MRGIFLFITTILFLSIISCSTNLQTNEPTQPVNNDFIKPSLTANNNKDLIPTPTPSSSSTVAHQPDSLLKKPSQLTANQLFYFNNLLVYYNTNEDTLAFAKINENISKAAYAPSKQLIAVTTFPSLSLILFNTELQLVSSYTLSEYEPFLYSIGIGSLDWLDDDTLVISNENNSYSKSYYALNISSSEHLTFNLLFTSHYNNDRLIAIDEQATQFLYIYPTSRPFSHEEPSAIYVNDHLLFQASNLPLTNLQYNNSQAIIAFSILDAEKTYILTANLDTEAMKLLNIKQHEMLVKPSQQLKQFVLNESGEAGFALITEEANTTLYYFTINNTLELNFENDLSALQSMSSLNLQYNADNQLEINASGFSTLYVEEANTFDYPIDEIATYLIEKLKYDYELSDEASKNGLIFIQ